MSQMMASMSYAGMPFAAASPMSAGLVDPHNPYASLLQMLPTAGAGKTMTLKGVPPKYRRSMLIEVLSRHCRGYFDFLFLPENPKVPGTNVGYAFINFRDSHSSSYFGSMFHKVKSSECLPGFDTKQVCEVSAAHAEKLQKTLVEFRARMFQGQGSENPDWHPICFDVNGMPSPFVLSGGSMPLRVKAPTFVPRAAQAPAAAKAIDPRALEFRRRLEQAAAAGAAKDGVEPSCAVAGESAPEGCGGAG